MSIIAAATSRADFYTLGVTSANVTAAQIAPYAKEGVNINLSTDYGRFSFPAMAEGWIQFHLYAGTSVSVNSNRVGQVFRLKSGEAGQVLFQLDCDGTVGEALEYWNGSAFVEVSEAVVFAASTRYKVDIQFKMHDTTGYFRVYLNDILIWEYTGDTIFTAATTLDTIEFAGIMIAAANPTTVISGLIIADEDTRSMIFHQGQATADGANTAWTGTYADVTELDRDDTDLIESGTANQVETFVMDDVDAALADYVPRAVILSTRTRRGATGPQNMQGVVRQSGVDYTTSNIAGISSAYGTRQAVMNTNPATSAIWTIAEVNAAEFGVKSIA